MNGGRGEREEWTRRERERGEWTLLRYCPVIGGFWAMC